MRSSDPRLRPVRQLFTVAAACVALAALTVGVINSSRTSASDALIRTLSKAHVQYRAVHLSLMSLSEAGQRFLLLGPSERSALAAAANQAKNAIAAFDGGPDVEAPLPGPEAITGLLAWADRALSQHALPADRLASEFDRKIDVLDSAFDEAFASQSEALVRQVTRRRDDHAQRGRIAFAVSLFALVLAIRLATQHLRAVAQQQGAAAERAEILERISDGFMALDADWRFTYVNAAAERSLMMGRNELLGRVIWDAIPATASHETAVRFREAMSTQKPLSYETYSKLRDSWYGSRLYPAPSGLSAYFRDITEERKMREALAQSELRHRQIVETAQEGIWIFGPEGKTTFVNRKLGDLLGYAPEEMIGKPLFDFLDREGQRLAAENLQRQAIGLRERHDFKFRRKDGRELWALLSFSPLAPDSASSDTVVMLTDITSRRRAEAERTQLSERERSLRLEAEASPLRYRVLADLVPQVVWTHGSDGAVDFVNRAFADFTGAPVERAHGFGWQTFLHPDDVPGAMEALKRSLATGEEFGTRARLRRADGVYVWMRARAQAVRDNHGQVIRWFGLLWPEPSAQNHAPPLGVAGAQAQS